MADTQETIADIIAEKRRQADEIERDVVEKMKRGEMTSDQYARELVADIRREADRLEAAHKRERGDCAKLRDALEKVQKKIKYLIGNLTVPNSLVASRMEINGIINAALAEPPRNCDVFTPNECRERFLKFCGRHYCNRNCPYFNCKDANECVLAFAQSPCGSGESNREKGGDK